MQGINELNVIYSVLLCVKIHCVNREGGREGKRMPSPQR